MTELTTMHAAGHHTAKHNGTWLYRGAGRTCAALTVRSARSAISPGRSAAPWRSCRYQSLEIYSRLALADARQRYDHDHQAEIGRHAGLAPSCTGRPRGSFMGSSSRGNIADQEVSRICQPVRADRHVIMVSSRLSRALLAPN